MQAQITGPTEPDNDSLTTAPPLAGVTAATLSEQQRLLLEFRKRRNHRRRIVNDSNFLNIFTEFIRKSTEAKAAVDLI